MEPLFFTLATKPLTIMYTNWKGVTRQRRLIPRSLSFGSNLWHPEPQWLLECYDLEDGDIKSFALKGFKLGKS